MRSYRRRYSFLLLGLFLLFLAFVFSNSPTAALDLSGLKDEKNVAYTYDPVTGQPLIRYTLDPNGKPIKTQYLLYDAQGNLTEIVDKEGKITGEVVYSSYGKITRALGDALQQDFTYTGREYERELDAFFFKERFYCPTTGRFFQEDRMEKMVARKRSPTNEIPTNLYRFVSNNPVNYVDRLGAFTGTATEQVGVATTRGTLAGASGVSFDYLSAKVNLAIVSLALVRAGQLLALSFDEEPLPAAAPGSVSDEYNDVIETLIPLAGGAGRLPPHCRDALKDSVLQCIIQYGASGTNPNRARRNLCLQDAMRDARDCVAP